MYKRQIKHNVLQYLRGEELNAVYDGYSFIALFLGTRYMTSFQHFYNGEPHWKNHLAPHYGIFSRFYFNRYTKTAVKLAGKYTGFKQNSGPPHYSWNPRYDALENNEYLNRHKINPDAARFGGEVNAVATE